MPIGSVEGLILSLLFVVPGGLGVELRRSVVPGAAPSAFRELLHALGATGVAIVAMELMFGLAGLLGRDVAMGDAVIGPLLQAEGTPASSFAWANYLGFVILALSLPLLAAAIRRTTPVKWLFRGVGLYPTGTDALFFEIWPGKPGRGAPWIVVATSDGRLVQGQLRWRSTAPHPVEVVLGDSVDITDPEDHLPGEPYVWFPTSSIAEIRVQPPVTEPDPAGQE